MSQEFVNVGFKVRHVNAGNCLIITISNNVKPCEEYCSEFITLSNGLQYPINE